MANRITKELNQSILDVCLQHCGTVESLFDVMDLNGLDRLELQPVMELFVPATQRPVITAYYTDQNKVLASMDATQDYRTHSNSFNLSFS